MVINVAPLLNAKFGEEPVRIEDLAARGGRIETAEEVPVGSAAPLRFHVPDTEVDVGVTAEVVWSDVKSVGPHRYRSGLRIMEKPELMRLAIGQLCESGRASMDRSCEECSPGQR